MKASRLTSFFFAAVILCGVGILSACASSSPSAAPSQKTFNTPSVVTTSSRLVPTVAPATTKAPQSAPAPLPTTTPAAASLPTISPKNTPLLLGTTAPAGQSQETSKATPTTALAPLLPTASPTKLVITASENAPEKPITATPNRLRASATALPHDTMTAEGRVVELEWPSQMRLGDSEIIRISLIPSQHGYTITTEFSEHQTLTNTVDVQRPTGYDIYAIGRLDAIGFDSSPASEQTLALPVDMPIHMRWTLSPHTAGQHRVATSLTLRWIPTEDNLGQSSEKMIFSKGLTINVIALLGMTTTQAITTGIMGLLAGSGLGMVAMASRKRLTRLPIHSDLPNSALVIEPRPGIQIQTEDETLLRTLFRRYGRLIVETEFLSGYSGARTLLTLPIRLDGRADAYTIAKLGDRASIEQEFSNYERFVKNTLPPITARIQEPPVIAAKEGISRLKRANAIGSRAVLRYTFIGEPGRHPISLREALLNDPDPTFLNKLFSTFGPNWWMQRRPYTFRLAQEYDRVLPAHFVIQPDKGAGKILDAHGAYGNRPWESIVGIGGHVTMHGFDRQELRMDGSSLSVSGNASNGQPALRVRWLSIQPPNGASGRIMSDRTALLRQSVYGFELFGLPDPLLRLPEWLNESVQGAQSTIHGDLNLENILVGPGGFVWLIDFAQTRDGHVLYDFAHLEAEIIAQVITRQVTSPLSFLEMLQNTPHPLLTTLHAIASNCVSNPTSMREYHLALCLACIGALKYGNQQANARHHLYLTAAHLSTLL